MRWFLRYGAVRGESNTWEDDDAILSQIFINWDTLKKPIDLPVDRIEPGEGFSVILYATYVCNPAGLLVVQGPGWIVNEDGEILSFAGSIDQPMVAIRGTFTVEQRVDMLVDWPAESIEDEESPALSGDQRAIADELTAEAQRLGLDY